MKTTAVRTVNGLKDGDNFMATQISIPGSSKNIGSPLPTYEIVKICMSMINLIIIFAKGNWYLAIALAVVKNEKYK